MFHCSQTPSSNQKHSHNWDPLPSSGPRRCAGVQVLPVTPGNEGVSESSVQHSIKGNGFFHGLYRCKRANRSTGYSEQITSAETTHFKTSLMKQCCRSLSPFKLDIVTGCVCCRLSATHSDTVRASGPGRDFQTFILKM